MNRLRFALLLPVAVLLPACATIGAGSVNRDRLAYAEALTSSWKEQTLLNIVKLRYADAPVFLEVSSVISSYQLQSQLSLLGTVSSNLTPNVSDTLGRGVTLGATGIYIDRPTITYTPLQGDRFTRELLRPIPPAALFQLVQAGYPIDLTFQLALHAINGIYNRSSRPMFTRAADPEFYQVLDALRRMQLSEAFDFRLEKQAPGEVSLITFHHEVPPAAERDQQFVRRALGLNPSAQDLTLTLGALPRSDRELALFTRSMLEILLELAGRVEVPAASVREGSTYPTPPSPPGGGVRDQPLVKIHSGAEPPANAFAAVRYNGHWFWIDNGDFRSKGIFTFLLLLTSLAQTGVVPQAPVITVPAS
jgi:hypothetical protein